MADAYTRAIDKVTFRDFLDAISPTPVVGDAVSGLLGLYDTGKGLFGDYKAAQEKDPRKMIRGMAGNVDNYTSGLLNAASVVPLVSPAIAGMFIGKNSKVWDALKADEAQKMLAKGVDPKEVWKKTGTFKGVDGALRQEIDDNLADIEKTHPAAYLSEMAQNSFNAKSLDEAKRIGDEYNSQLDQVRMFGSGDGVMPSMLLHRNLYESYPELKKTRVKWEGGDGGSFLPEQNTVTIGYRNIADSNKTKSTTLHELQHAIQEREGWARGGNSDMFSGSPAFGVPQDIKVQISAKQKEIDDAINAVMKQRKIPSSERWRAENSVKANSNLFSELASLKKQTTQLSPFESYRRLAGEAESRLTQSRMNMTMPERLQVYPYDMLDVPQDQLIVRGLLGD